jgi:hypothetical protein
VLELRVNVSSTSQLLNCDYLFVFPQTRVIPELWFRDAISAGNSMQVFERLSSRDDPTGRYRVWIGVRMHTMQQVNVRAVREAPSRQNKKSRQRFSESLPACAALVLNASLEGAVATEVAGLSLLV